MKNIVKTACAILASIGIGASAAYAEAEDDIAWIAIAEINDGVSISDVDDLVAQVTSAVAENPGTLSFDVARADRTLFIYEKLDDPAALMAHANIVMEYMPKMQALWTTTQMVPTRHLPEDVEAMMVNFGAQIPNMVSVVSKQP